MPSRTFSESDARDVFARAARLQQQEQASGAAGSGLTLEELQEIGRAAGLDPALVAAAAGSLAPVAAEKAPAPARLGIPARIVRTRRFAAPLSDAAWEAIVDHLRQQFRAPGTAGQVGRIREWTGGGAAGSGTGTGDVRVALRPTPGGGGELTIEQRGMDQNGLGFAVAGASMTVTGLLLSAIFLATGQAGVALPMLLIFLTMGAALGGGGTLWLRRWARTRAGQFEAILDRAELLAAESGRAGARLTLPDESWAGDTPDERGAPGHTHLRS